MKTAILRSSLSAALLVGLAGGCMTLNTRSDPTYDGSRVYSGTRVDLAQGVGQLLQFSTGMLLFFGDLPLSFIVDTVLLPVTIPEERARRTALEAQLQTRTDNPSVIELRPDEGPIETARRLFETCRDLTEQLSIRVLDCYALEARVVRVSADGIPTGLTGAAYKQKLVDTLKRAKYAGLFISYRDPSFEPQGDAVRVEATRVTSQSAERNPVRFLMGPGEDGQWRILEEQSRSWP
jgi:uncharacterized protein YceK